MDPQPLFSVISPLILVRRGPENEAGATIAHLTLGVGGGGELQGQNEGARLVLEATFRRPHDANELETKKIRFRKELNSLILHN